MKRNAQPAALGVFVIVALSLFTVGIVIFGSGALLNDSLEFVLYFEDSVKGLNVGAPVMFRGVKVGTVTDINVTIDPHGAVRIPVTIAMDMKRIRQLGQSDTRQQAYDYINRMVDKGLRAVLEVQSFVTGQLVVQFDFFPNDPPAERSPHGDTLPELPTRASALQKLSRYVDQMPLADIAQRTADAVDDLVTLVQSPEFRQGARDLTGVLRDLQELVRQANEATGPIITDLRDTLTAFRQTVDTLNQHIDPLVGTLSGAAADTSALMRAAKSTVDSVGPKLDAVADSTRQTLATVDTTIGAQQEQFDDLIAQWRRAGVAVQEAIEEAQKTLAILEQNSGPSSPAYNELLQAVREVNRTAQSVRHAADYLRRHPEALIHGKGKPSENQP